MRLAYASPFPPLSSGIADFSAELVPALAAAGAEIELFYEGDQAPSGELGGRYRARPVGELAANAGELDAILYHVGNSAPHHAEIYRTALRVPGIAVLHEAMLHHLVRELTLARGDSAGYLEEMRYAAGETGRRAALRLLDTHFPVDVWAFPLAERLLDRSRGALVHSEFARRRLAASRPAAAIEVVPFPADLERDRPADSAARERARARLGLAPETFWVASFGFVTPQKHLDAALAGCARFVAARDAGSPPARLAIVGEISRHFDFASVVAASGAPPPLVTGRVEREVYDAWMDACDVAVNLRHPTGGETSASLFRLLSRGIPTLASAAGSFAELPDGVVAKVAVDALEIDRIAALLARLESEPELGRALGRTARAFVEERHSLTVAARGYLDAIERMRVLPDPQAGAPPLAPWRIEEAGPALLASLGADLVDLGIDREAPEGLAALAVDWVELGLDRPER